MPLADPPRPSMDLKSVSEVTDYLIGFVRWLADFINHIDTLNVDELSADVVNTGLLNAMLVTIGAQSGGNTLTIDQNGMTANNGSVDTLQFDLATGLLTIVSAIIKSAAGYPMIAFNLNNNIMQAFSDANNHVDISPSSGGSPGMAWYVSNVLTAYLNCTSLGPLLASFNGAPATIQASGNLNLSTGGNLTVNSTAAYNGPISYTKSISSDGMGNYFPVNGTITVTKGIITGVS